MDKKMNFKYFYGTEADQFSFYRIPKALFTNDCFKDLSSDAKILYGLMLDRMSLSIKNQWFDEENRAYIYFSIEDIMELLNCGRNKAVKSLQELDDEKGIGLIEKRRQGFGKVTIIYVKSFIQEECEEEKKEKSKMLEGAIFGLFTKEDIKGRDGKVLMEAGTLIEQKTTDENGQILFKADLPVDGTYIVKEIYAPDGFVTSNEEKEFTFEYGKPEEAEVSYEFVFENEPTTVELTKTDLTTGKELPGAHLKVTDEDGNVIEEWVSTEKAHVIKELTVGKSYTMTETKPADGYVTAESITFTVENTAEIQKQEMKDDVTKVLISKQDIAGKELPGAKLTILDEDGKVVESWTSTEEAHYIEMLPIGKYTLREETAPEGYLVAKDVEFEVKDTAEVQKVVMVDEEKPKESTPEGGKPSKDAPKTGDNTNLLLWLIVLGMSLSGVVVLGRKIKKK